jgi:hypothetical protein
VHQRTGALASSKVERAFLFIRRWNEPVLEKRKHDFRTIIDSGKAHDADYLEKHLTQNPELRTIVVEVLNFFEEIGLASNMGLADDETLERYFYGALTSYHSCLEAWIQRHRASIARPKMWIELEQMLTRWHKNH